MRKIDLIITKSVFRLSRGVLFSVLRDGHAGPVLEGPGKGGLLTVTNETGNLINAHLRIGDIGQGQQFLDLLDFLLVGGVLLGELALHGPDADAQRLRHFLP